MSSLLYTSNLNLGGARRASLSRDDELRNVQRETTDYFKEWGASRADRYDRHRRRHDIARITHPRPGRWPGHFDLLDPGVWPPVDVIRHPYLLSSSLGSNAGVVFVTNVDTRGRLTEAGAAVEWVGRRFRPARFRLRKRLGYGGCGVAALFEMMDRRGKVFPVVVKTDLQRDRGDMIRKERENMISMTGANHMVQRLLLQTLSESDDDNIDHGFETVNASPGWDSLDSTSDPTSRINGLGWTGARAGVQAGFGILRNAFHRFTRPSSARQPQTPQRGGLQSRSNVSDGSDGNARDDGWTMLDTVSTARRRLDDREDVILMEYVRRGDLATWISKMNDLPVKDWG